MKSSRILCFSVSVHEFRPLRAKVLQEPKVAQVPGAALGRFGLPKCYRFIELWIK